MPLPVKTNGDRVVTLGELADISLTFQDRDGTSRFNGETTVALQVVKRKGYNLLDIAETVKQIIDTAKKDWPEQMRATVQVGTSNDQSVRSQVNGTAVGKLGSHSSCAGNDCRAVLAGHPRCPVGWALQFRHLFCCVLRLWLSWGSPSQTWLCLG